MITLGIDLATEPAGTAACSINWVSGDVTPHREQLDDEALISLIAASDVAAIDVPLGWPSRFLEAITEHHHHREWPVDTGKPRWRRPLQYRMTDIVVNDAGASPLSVSTDRIGSTAMRGAGLQHLLAGRGIPVDRTGCSGRLIETYPAAVLRRWGMSATGYKRAGGAGVRRELVRNLGIASGPLRAPLSRALHDCDDDLFDAAICALVAAAVGIGVTMPPQDGVEFDHAVQEGWIHLPTVPLEDIVAAALANAR